MGHLVSSVLGIALLGTHGLPIQHLGTGGRPDPHRLDVGELADAARCQVPPVARPLHLAERQPRVRGVGQPVGLVVFDADLEMLALAGSPAMVTGKLQAFVEAGIGVMLGMFLRVVEEIDLARRSLRFLVDEVLPHFQNGARHRRRLDRQTTAPRPCRVLGGGAWRCVRYWTVTGATLREVRRPPSTRMSGVRPGSSKRS